MKVPRIALAPAIVLPRTAFAQSGGGGAGAGGSAGGGAGGAVSSGRRQRRKRRVTLREPVPRLVPGRPNLTLTKERESRKGSVSGGQVRGTNAAGIAAPSASPGASAQGAAPAGASGSHDDKRAR